MKRRGFKRVGEDGASSSDEREEVIWQISKEVDLLPKGDEGEQFCHAINV